MARNRSSLDQVRGDSFVLIGPLESRLHPIVRSSLLAIVVAKFGHSVVETDCWLGQKREIGSCNC